MYLVICILIISNLITVFVLLSENMRNKQNIRNSIEHNKQLMNNIRIGKKL